MANAAAKSKGHVLYLVRHAIAAERGKAWPDDSQRPLTAKGVARFRRVVRGLREIPVAVDVVMTSPLVRAKQTSEILIEGLKPKPTQTVASALAPGHSPLRAAEAIGLFGKARRMALVGHEPDLGKLAAWLIGADAPVEFKKGGVCRIDIPSAPPAKGSGKLIWFAPPRMLTKLRT